MLQFVVDEQRTKEEKTTIDTFMKHLEIETFVQYRNAKDPEVLLTRKLTTTNVHDRWNSPHVELSLVPWLTEDEL